MDPATTEPPAAGENKLQGSKSGVWVNADLQGQQADTQEKPDRISELFRETLPPSGHGGTSEIVGGSKAHPKLWIAISSALGVLLILIAGFAVWSYRDASDWEQKSNSFQAKLADSEEDVDRLDKRVKSLTNEKAATEEERDLATAFFAAAADVADQMQSCVVETNTFMDLLIDSYEFGYVSDELYAQAATADTVCNDAQAAYDELATAYGALDA